QGDSSTIAEISCYFAFPDDYGNFPPLILSDPYADFTISHEDEIDYDNFSVTRTWKIADGCGNVLKHYYVIKWSGSAYAAKIDAVYINDNLIPGAQKLCSGDIVDLRIETSNSCSDDLKITWYLDGDDTADAEGDAFEYLWSEDGKFDIQILAN